MRVLVGTLYSQENEFRDCLDAIAAQTYPTYEHRVIAGLPKREAHRQLYRYFLDNPRDFQVLIKVDADMILSSREFFADVADRFQRHPHVDLVTVRVHDFFTDRLIWGLNSYRNRFEWPRQHDAVFTDSMPIPRWRQICDSRELAPAASHCANPSDFQAFHFGVHRGVKAAVAAARGNRTQARTRCWDLERTWLHLKRRPDVRLALACLGGELAIDGSFGPEHLDYGATFPQQVFAEYQDSDLEALAKEVRKLRRSNSGRLPWYLRAEALRWAQARSAVQ